MNKILIKSKKPGQKGYAEYLIKSGILIFCTVFGIAVLIILGVALYLRLTMY